MPSSQCESIGGLRGILSVRSASVSHDPSKRDAGRRLNRRGFLTGVAAAGAGLAAGPALRAQAKPAIVIQAYNDGLAGVRAANPDVHLGLVRDPSVSEGNVLRVDYPAPTKDPASRDVQCAAQHQDWTSGRAILFQIKPAHSVKLSLSFLDRNRVAYTAWRELKGGVWQWVRISFDEIRPNPFFQLPGAKSHMPLDVSEVKSIAFAPHDETSGALEIGEFFVSR